MLKLSIIIPVYNVEKYIRKCLESCLQQNIRQDEYEIIVVNDGTPDHSIKEVLSVQNNQKTKTGTTNIRVVDRENGGLSAARNTGLKEAKGEYVWFVDSDDWIEPNVLYTLVDNAINNNLDILCFTLQFVFPDGKKRKRIIDYEEKGKIYKGEDFISKVGMPPAAWLALYRREYLISNSLKFYEGIIHEDQEFTPRAYCLAEKISFVDEVIYNYNQREGGIMKSKQNVRRCKDLLTVADSLYHFACEKTCKDSPAYYAIMNKVAFVFSQSLSHYDVTAFPLKVYSEKEYYPLCISNTLSRKTKWKYRLANFSLKLYLLIYRTVK